MNIHQRTRSRRINSQIYFQRLKSSSTIKSNQQNSKSKSKINFNENLLRKTDSSFVIQSKQRFQSEENDEKDDLIRRSSISIKSSCSSSNQSKLLKRKPNLFSHHRSMKNETHEFERRSSTTTNNSSLKGINFTRPPSSPIDRRCDRIYSSIIKPICRETCSLLGPDLCSDCIEIQTKSQLTFDSSNSIQQRLSSLAIRRFLTNNENLTDQQIDFIRNHQDILYSNQENQFQEFLDQIPNDEIYFDQLTKNLLSHFSTNHFYFQNLKDLALKYQKNLQAKINLSDYPSIETSNPIFKQLDRYSFDSSSKYSSMKISSKDKYQIQLDLPVFFSSRKSQRILSSSRSIQHSSLALNSHSFLQSTKQTQTLIGSQIHQDLI